MPCNFDNISKDSIIEEISSLKNELRNIKYVINTSFGKLTNIDNNRALISDNFLYLDVPMKNMDKKDLIIILRYFQNMKKCKDIISKYTTFGEIYDLDWNTWEKIPLNKDVVKKRIKDYLIVKKNVATIDKRKIC